MTDLILSHLFYLVPAGAFAFALFGAYLHLHR